MSDDVMKLLDSLDVTDDVTTGAAGGKTDTTDKSAATEKTTDSKDDDIMGFLESLATKSGKNTPIPPSAGEKEVAKDTSHPAAAKPDAPAATEIDPLSSISSWWNKNSGGIWNTASNTIKQAEAKVRENLDEEQAQKAQKKLESWGSLAKSSLQSTLSSVLETIAPPISRHEQLKIHIFHDMVGYSSIDMLVYSCFELVMNQVEGGGDLTMVVQKGKERNRRGSDHLPKRDLGLFNGSLDQAKKLAAANIEDYLKNISAPDKSSTSQPDNTSDLVRVSNIYLSIVPASLNDIHKRQDTFVSVCDNSFAFIVYMSDPEHDITYTTVSQPFPLQWSEWLDTPDNVWSRLDVDPNEWILPWVEDGLRLAVGIVAQSYVSKRMGVESLFSHAASAGATEANTPEEK